MLSLYPITSHAQGRGGRTASIGGVSEYGDYSDYKHTPDNEPEETNDEQSDGRSTYTQSRRVSSDTWGTFAKTFVHLLLFFSFSMLV